jgi:hypothetical protein
MAGAKLLRLLPRKAQAARLQRRGKRGLDLLGCR